MRLTGTGRQYHVIYIVFGFCPIREKRSPGREKDLKAQGKSKLEKLVCFCFEA